MTKLDIVIKAIAYIEENLNKKIDLEDVAKNIHYSKYHLHRSFTSTVGITVHNYVLRRKMTQAAEKLIYTNMQIMDIALETGYESQQAFSVVFRELYKKSPKKFRDGGRFYPLQLSFALNHCRQNFNFEDVDWENDICQAKEDDIESWMDLVRHVIDGFPGLDQDEYIRNLERCINEKRALVMKDGGKCIAVLVFNYETAEIEFLGIHPLYKQLDLEKIFLIKLKTEYLKNRDIYISTFRPGDKADLGYRRRYLELGFEYEKCQVEYGYPTQRLILKNDTGRGR